MLRREQCRDESPMCEKWRLDSDGNKFGAAA